MRKWAGKKRALEQGSKGCGGALARQGSGSTHLIIFGSLLYHHLLELVKNLGRNVQRVIFMNCLGCPNGGGCSQVFTLYQAQHDLKTPCYRNALSFSGLAQRPIVRQAGPAVVSGKHQTKLVLKRQRTTPL